jgi:AAA+ superfamily predicted ATPase
VTDDALLASLLAAVEARPDDVPLRLHLGRLLIEQGRPADALTHCTVVLQRDPTNRDAIALLGRATQALTAGSAAGSPPPPAGSPPPPPPAGRQPPLPASGPPRRPSPTGSEFDWNAAERELRGIAEPPFVADGPTPGEPVLEQAAGIRLADVGGMREVKQRLEVAFLGPMRNPQLARLYGKSLRGGLLLYGPPGCGKTFIAKAVAGELGARFYSVSLADVLDAWLGAPERNIREIFLTARQNAPCVLFLDEVDAIGHRRSRIGSGWVGLRSAVNQLLAELDSVDGDNEGVFVLAATNHPWDVDPALRRPGRLDRTILVLPPDPAAREAILRYHLRRRPLAGIDLPVLVRRTEDFSGADLAHLVDSAAELAMVDSVRSGQVRPIGMDDFGQARKQVGPSTGPWLQTARNVVQFANAGGEYDELLAYLKSRKMV